MSESTESLQGLIDTERAAKRLGLHPQTLRQFRSAGGGPPFVKIGAAVRYDPADLQEFIAARKRRSTSECEGAA
jgi:DNA-binding transcriptional MerR regulator